MLKKSLLMMLISCVTVSASAFDYVPKNTEQNPFEKTNSPVKPILQREPNTLGNKEITNLNEYFQYLPYEVNKNWKPYKANADYEVTVQFRVHNDGSITDTEITNSTNPNANASVLNAVKSGSPYKPLPKSYPSNSVKAQVILEYHK